MNDQKASMVVVAGKEKQTDNAHLFIDHPIQCDIVKVLQSMSESQLQQVLQFGKELDQSGTRAGCDTTNKAFPILIPKASNGLRSL
jgi:hypothetical protein